MKICSNNSLQREQWYINNKISRVALRDETGESETSGLCRWTFPWSFLSDARGGEYSVGTGSVLLEFAVFLLFFFCPIMCFKWSAELIPMHNPHPKIIKKFFAFPTEWKKRRKGRDEENIFIPFPPLIENSHIQCLFVYLHLPFFNQIIIIKFCSWCSDWMISNEAPPMENNFEENIFARRTCWVLSTKTFLHLKLSS